MESSKEFIDLVVTSDVQTFYSRRRFPLKITVGELKKKVEILTGIPFSCMTLQIVKPDGQKLKLFDANETLADLNISDGTTIHAIDENQKTANLYEVANVLYVILCFRTSETDFKPGLWIGVEYDEEVGKHDGSVNGKRYFQCMDKRGAFVRPHLVKTETENEEALELLNAEPS
ncbi:Tubulin-folding cofactor B [Trichinella papuae]|uniref:Tubulin-folding cofactor B n=1 Tax=Trichinella papuae TaxID=268474 RepID=A0A0V1MZD5_9BILA|nr:Tubulin-folding cofactor B [Trichinella papuae]